MRTKNNEIDTDAIRTKALRMIDEAFDEEEERTVLKRHIMEISLDRVGLPFCPACESRRCGLCGKCHELDWEPDERNPLNFGPYCPLSVPTMTDACNKWNDGYIFLKYAEQGLEKGES